MVLPTNRINPHTKCMRNNTRALGKTDQTIRTPNLELTTFFISKEDWEDSGYADPPPSTNTEQMLFSMCIESHTYQ